jgi:hypothetical protein
MSLTHSKLPDPVLVLVGAEFLAMITTIMIKIMTITIMAINRITLPAPRVEPTISLSLSAYLSILSDVVRKAQSFSFYLKKFPSSKR